MLKKHTRTFAGISAVGAAALLLSGCGGSSFSKNTFGNYPNTLPYAYGIEPVAFYGQANAIGQQGAYEGSGLQNATTGQAYITDALDFTATTANGATFAITTDPNGTGKVPLGFSAGGLYVDNAQTVAGAVATVTSVAPGTSVFFRTALANGIANNSAAGITSAVLTSTDAQLAAVPGLTAGLPMTLNVVGGPFSNATYVTGTSGTATPFTLPASTTTGLHTVVVTVNDDAGRQTATTFAFPVVTSADVALFLQSFAATSTTSKAIAPGDTVTIDGGAGLGTYPAGFSATTADAQGTVVLFTTPGTHTLTETTSTGTVVQTSTFTIAAEAAGTTIFNVPLTTATAPATIRAHAVKLH